MTAADDQLFDPPSGTPGDARSALERDLTAIADADRAGYEALIAMARHAADAVDLAHERKDTYALTAAMRELRSTIERLPVSILPSNPTAGGGDDDDAQFWDLMRGNVGDTTH